MILSASFELEGYPQVFEKIGDHIKARRLELGLTQTELARLVGVSMETVGNWEKGRTSNIHAGIYKNLIHWLGYCPTLGGTSTLGGKFRAVRLQKGLTLKQAARLLGCDEGSISAWESGRKRVAWPRIRAMMKSFIEDI